MGCWIKGIREWVLTASRVGGLVGADFYVR
uniref:Uncharacterized protein n=1 Tax=Siphoviridae sp. cthSp75 TaxID=2826424 RepID=A0A8S5NF62_9CAUD|nr:MAG TPA: hypothetical protein [Siphoviridae sp. cthSp75]